MAVSGSEERWKDLKDNWGMVYYSPHYQSLSEKDKNIARLEYAKKIGVPKEVHHSFITGKFDERYMVPKEQDILALKAQEERYRRSGFSKNTLAKRYSDKEAMTAREGRRVEDAGMEGFVEAVETSPNTTVAGVVFEKATGDKIVSEDSYDRTIGYEYEPQGFLQNLAHYIPAMVMDTPALKAFGLVAKGATSLAAKAAERMIPGGAKTSTLVDNAFRVATGAAEKAETPLGKRVAEKIVGTKNISQPGIEFSLYTGTHEQFNPNPDEDDAYRVLKAAGRGMVEGMTMGFAGKMVDGYVEALARNHTEKLKRIASKRGLKKIDDMAPTFEEIAELKGIIDKRAYSAARKKEMTENLIKQRAWILGIPVQGVALTTAQAVTHGDPSMMIDPNTMGMNLAMGGAMHVLHTPLRGAGNFMRNEMTRRLWGDSIEMELASAKYENFLKKTGEKYGVYEKDFQGLMDKDRIGKTNRWEEGIVKGENVVAKLSGDPVFEEMRRRVASDPELASLVKDYAERRANTGDSKNLSKKRVEIVNKIMEGGYNEFYKPIGEGKNSKATELARRVSVHEMLDKFLESGISYDREPLKVYRSDKGWEIREARSNVDGKVRYQLYENGSPVKKAAGTNKAGERIYNNREAFNTLEDAQKYAAGKQKKVTVLSMEEDAMRGLLYDKIQSFKLHEEAEKAFFALYPHTPKHLVSRLWKEVTGTEAWYAGQGDTSEFRKRRGGEIKVYEASGGHEIKVPKKGYSTTQAAVDTLINGKYKEAPAGMGRITLKWQNAPRALRDAAGSKFSDMIFNMTRQAANNYMLEQNMVKNQVEALTKKYSPEELERVGRYFVGKQTAPGAKTETGEPAERIMTGLETLKRMGKSGIDLESLTPKEKELVSMVKRNFENLFDRYNMVRIMAGYRAIPRANAGEDYFPLFRNFTIAEEMGMKPGALDGKTSDEWHKNGFQAWGNSVKRVDSLRAVELNPLVAYSRYASNIIRNIHNGPVIAKLTEYTQGIMKSDGEMYYMKRDNPYAYEIVTGIKDKLSGFESKGNKYLDQIMRKISNNVVASTLGWYAGTVMNQMGAIDGTLSMVGPKHTMEGLSQAMTKEGRAFAMAHSTELPTRIMDVHFNADGLAITTAERSKIMNMLSSGQRVLDKYNDWSMKPMQAMDIMSAQVSWLSSYDYLVNTCKWKPNSIETFRQADRMLLDVQGSGKTIDLTPFQTTGFGKFITTFQTFTINRFNWLMSDVVGPIAGKGNAEIGRREAIGRLFKYAVASSVVGAAYEGIGASTGLKVSAPSASLTTTFLDVVEGIDDNRTLGQLIAIAAFDQLTIVPLVGSLKYGGTGTGGPNISFLIDVGMYLSSLQGGQRIPDYQVKSIGYLLGKSLGIAGTQQLSSMIKTFDSNQKAMFEKAMADAKEDRGSYGNEISRMKAEMYKDINALKPGNKRKAIDIEKKRDYPKFGEGGYKKADNPLNFLIKK